MALLELTAMARGSRATSDLAVYVDHGLRAEAVAEAATCARPPHDWG